MQILSSKLRIVLLGYIIRGPLGGLVWHHLQYALGFKKMGHEILFLEDSEDYPSCYDPQINEMTINPAYGLKFIKEIFDRFDMTDQWAYYHEHGKQWFGLSQKTVMDFCKRADLIINLSGINPVRDYTAQIPKRVLIDTDPVFTQVRHLTEIESQIKANQHTHFFSFGENIGQSFCSVPNDGFPWQTTRQPVVLDCWKMSEGNPTAAWTTVMQWDSYKTREYDGRSFGMKSNSFAPYIDLPEFTGESFELAIGSTSAPTDLLKKKGWKVLSSLTVTKTAETYQQFIRQSKGEWSVAKEGYVISNSGWFSERSAGYLASSLPVIVQDTGFSKFIETGNGLLSFSSLNEVVEAIEKINSNYTKHCKWAREIAEKYFDHNAVLNSLLDKIYTTT